MDRRKPRDRDLQLLTGSQRSGWKRAQTRFFAVKACGSGLIALVDQILQEVFVGGATRKVTTASCPQGLVNCLLEPMMGLFHIPIFVSNASVVPGRLHPVMSHECLVPVRPLLAFGGGFVSHRCGQVIGAMLPRNPANGPQARF